MNSLLKKTTLATAVSLLLPSAAMANVIITEYIEGSSNNKAVEISNIGSTDVDMGAEAYRLSMYTNGSPTAHEERFYDFTGVLAAGQSFVVYNDSADDEFKPVNGAGSSVTWFNGDDALVLSKNGVAVDSLGRVGEDPGSEWTDANNADWGTKEYTLRRMNSVTMGDDVIDDEFPGASNQWVAFPQNTSDGLGCIGEAACSAAPMSPLLITEYIEGSSNNKAVEVTNMTASELDVTGYRIVLYTNGSAEPSDRAYDFTGTLAAGASFVLYNGGADDAFKPANGAESNVTWFNGDDAIVLSLNGEVVDSFGRVGEDPGSEWLDANNADWSSKEYTLRRKASVTVGDTLIDDEFPGSDNQWLAFPQNTSDGLGCGGEGACENVAPANHIVITEYVEGSSNNKAVEISNLGSSDVDLGAMKYAMHLYRNGALEPSPDNTLELTGVLAAGTSFVVYNEGADAEFQFTDPAQGIASTLTWFNGDDAITLTRDGEIVDSFGRVGEDPGSAWTDANNPEWSTQDKTLRRMASVTNGDAVADDEFPGSPNQWLAFETDNWRGLGCPGEDFCPGNDPIPENHLLITEYVEGSDMNRAIELTNKGETAVDLAEMQYALAYYNDGYDGVHSSTPLMGMIEPGASFVVYNSNAAAEFQFPDAGMGDSSVNFTGDDAVVLTIQGRIVDSIGRIGEDPGEGWTDASNEDWSTYNRTLRRLPFVTSGDGDATDAFPGESNQWLAFPIDTASGLGCDGVVACDGSDGSDGPENLMITEYVEGSGNNKVIEITNMGESAVNMAAGNYKLALFVNGDTTESTDRKIFLTATLQPGESFMVYNDSADAAFQFPNNGEASAATFFNGNDAVVLTRNGEVVDSLGRVGEDPSGGWWTDPNDSNFATRDRTLRRKDSITEGDTVVDDAFPGDDNQWVTFPMDTSNGLGCAGEASCNGDDDDSVDPSEVENYVLITEYVEGSGSNKAIELSNVGTVDVDLMLERYRLETYSNGNTLAFNTVNLFGLLKAGSSIVVYNRDAEDSFKKDAPQGIGSNVTFFNGDDAIVLRKGGIQVDSIGQVGSDPGDFWSDANDENFATQNKTIRRKADVMQGDYTLNDAFPGEANEWVTFDNDTFDGLGCMGEMACTGDEVMPEVGAGGGVTFGDCVNCPEISKVAESSMYDATALYGEIAAMDERERMDAIKALLKDSQVSLTYGQVWSVLTFSDQDPENADNIIELYTGNSVAKNMNGSGANANDPNSWNREHVWAKSYGFPGESQAGYTDAHNLRPSNWAMNSTKSNLNFDNGGEEIVLNDMATGNFKDNDSFEPRDEVKGDVARMLFYMHSRYNGVSGDDGSNLELVDMVKTDTSANAEGVVEFGKLCTLWEWHQADGVSDAEVQRNEVVYQYQGNRNPFIDNPDWVRASVAKYCQSFHAPVATIDGPTSMTENQMVTIDASSVVDADFETMPPQKDEESVVAYKWMVPEGIVIGDDEASSISFNAPFIEEATEYTVTLQLTDYWGVSAEQTFTFTVENTNQSAPQASITGPVVANEGATVNLDGTGSSDADGYALTYHWRQLTDSHISFQYDAGSISFTAPQVSADTPIEFELTVTDGEYSSTTTYTVVIEDTAESDDIISGGSMGVASLLMLPLFALRRRKLLKAA